MRLPNRLKSPCFDLRQFSGDIHFLLFSNIIPSSSYNNRRIQCKLYVSSILVTLKISVLHPLLQHPPEGLKTEPIPMVVCPMSFFSP